MNPVDLEGNTYPSGYGYFPSTVSEMVHDPADPAGKCFFAFELIGSIFIFVSWYPWELRNVYIGDDEEMFPGVSWVMARQFIPAPGMMIVATVSTTPIAKARPIDFICIGIHLTGALLLFVGYVIIEGKTLGWGVFKRAQTLHINQAELRVRLLALSSLFGWYCAFCAVQVVMCVLPPDMPGNDRWSYEDSDGIKHNAKVLVDTAYGWFLYLKIFSYACEVICGVCLICNFLCIWYFAVERNIDLEENIEDIEAYAALAD